tara:strand:+ start:106 stop:279 length:174 start_codon:yes stop_codon:yes gene_type:complete
VGFKLTYREVNSILISLEKDYLKLAKSSPENRREGMYGVYTIKKVRGEILKYLDNNE